MIGFFRNPSTWAIESQTEVFSYDLPLYCQKGETGTATCQEITGNYDRYVFELDGVDGQWVVNGSGTVDETNIQTITLEDITALFDIPNKYSADSGIQSSQNYKCNLITTERQYPDYSVAIREPTLGESRWMPERRYFGSLDGVDAFHSLTIRFDATNDAYYASQTFYSDIDDTLSYVDYTAGRELLESGSYSGSPRDDLRSVMMSGATVQLIVGVIKSTSVRLTPMIGDGVQYGDHVYVVDSVEQTIAQVHCHMDDTATAHYLSVQSPSESSGVYDIFMNGASLLTLNYSNQVSYVSAELNVKSTEYSDAVPVYFDDGHATVITESYDSADTITGLWLISSSTGSSVGNFYLNEDGTVSKTDRTQQAQGKFAQATADVTSSSTEAEQIAAAQAEFAKNETSHKVEFYSDKEYGLGQPVKLMLKRCALDTAISSIYISSADKRKRYICGDLPTTAAEHIKASSWKYGRRLPRNPRKGQLVIV